jgi:hypothetical protein
VKVLPILSWGAGIVENHILYDEIFLYLNKNLTGVGIKIQCFLELDKNAISIFFYFLDIQFSLRVCLCNVLVGHFPVCFFSITASVV